MTPRFLNACTLALGLAGVAAVSAQEPVPDAVRERHQLGPFYQKYINLDGFPILGSAKVSDPAMREAAWILRHMLSVHPEILKTMAAANGRLVVMAYNEYTIDIPEQADMKPKDFWDKRARGLGGELASCAEENMLCFPTDPYNTENILIHEFSHAIASCGLKTLVPDFDKRLEKAYQNAKAKKLWDGTYAGSNSAEYWAESTQDWFDNNRQNDSQHNRIHTRTQLLEYDPEIAALCRDVFGDTDWRYKKPTERPEEDRAHLAGYDPAKAPKFEWRKTEGGSEQSSRVPFNAQPLPLSAVRLTGGPLKHAQELDADYLLKLEPDRMLYFLRKRAGLEPKAKDGYGGWDGDGRQLTGHIAGHYLSAVSYMYAATGDVRFKKRADYIVGELKEIQDKQGDGYIGALMAEVMKDGKKQLVDGKQRFEDLGNGIIQSGGFDLNGMWSPWYVQHKIYAGLRDAYRMTGNKTALEVEVKFAEWADRILSKLDEAQIQKMLSTEFGGMNEVMADLYADTGDERWRKAFQYFEHKSIVIPLAEHKDILAGKHGNTQVPKLLGELKYYIATGSLSNGSAAKYFWREVADHHSFATGGHGKDEYFGEPDKLNDRVDGRTAETCNVYNMLKMERLLFALEPDGRYAEFEERALFNHILASIDDKDGRTCYMVPVGRGVTHEYQDMFESFTCCVGSGMESHALHGDVVELTLPKALHAEPVPDNPRRVALMWGPLVLAGNLGPEGERVRTTVPVFVSDDMKISNWLKPVDGKPGEFGTVGVGHERDVDFSPFYRLHQRTYAVYWDLFSAANWETRAGEIAAERERLAALEKATVAYAQPGEMQTERDFNQQGEDSEPDRIMGRPARRGKSWFSFDLPVDPTHLAAVVVTYYSDEWRKRTFDIVVDGSSIGSQTVEKGGTPKFFDVRYALPADLIRDKKKVTVRFQANGGNEIAAVFGIRMIRVEVVK